LRKRAAKKLKKEAKTAAREKATEPKEEACSMLGPGVTNTSVTALIQRNRELEKWLTLLDPRGGSNEVKQEVALTDQRTEVGYNLYNILYNY
jgi:hypothetical protein